MCRTTGSDPTAVTRKKRVMSHTAVCPVTISTEGTTSVKEREREIPVSFEGYTTNRPSKDLHDKTKATKEEEDKKKK